MNIQHSPYKGMLYPVKSLCRLLASRTHLRWTDSDILDILSLVLQASLLPVLHPFRSENKVYLQRQ